MVGAGRVGAGTVGGKGPMTNQQHAEAIPGTWNFRDIGGTPTASGPVRSGLVYRSAALARLDETGLRALDSLGVTRVFDLRGHREIARDGADRVPDTVAVTVAPFHPEGDDAPAHEAQQAAEAQGRPWTQADRVRAYYAAIPTLAPAQQSVASLLRTVADGAGGVLVHCAAGKDRTGWAIASLLMAAGAARDAVMADYLLSNSAIESLRSWMLAQYGEDAHRANDDILGVHESYLQAAWDAAEAGFGSFEGYLDAIGVDDGVVRRLRARLLG